MATLSNTDKANLNAEQQKQVQALKKQWEAAATQAEKDSIHAQAEEIRKQASSGGYTAGASGTGYQKLAASSGGMTADQMAKWLEDYNATNYRAGSGWTNGYSTAMNVRAKANQVRQQMQANEQAMANADADTQNYLHQQNLDLAQLLYQYTGHTDKTTYYNEAAKRWETWNPDVGYGYNMQFTQPNIVNDHKNFYGYTDADIAKYSNDPSLYYNFVDPNTNRLAIDERSGYTGKYSQFVNGPYAQLLGGGTHNGAVNPAVYTDLYGDGFGKEGPTGRFTPIRDENGNVLNAEAPALKHNNAMSDYTNQFTSYVSNGVIQPGLLVGQNPGADGEAGGAYSYKTGYGADASDPRYTGGVDRDVIASTPHDPNNLAGQMAYFYNTGGKTAGVGPSGSSVGTYEDEINRMYAAALEAQMAQLKTGYDRNASDLDAENGAVDDAYTEQKRQTTGTNAQEAANWREMANAYGLNSGAVGQAALAQSNRLQSNLNALEQAQAAAQTEIARQKSLLRQEYEAAIRQAVAENDYQRAMALYEDAVRAEELLWQKEKYYTDLMLQYSKLALRSMPD